MEKEIKISTKKKCAKCKRVLLVEEFPTDNRSKDKLWRYCRKCESVRKKKYREAKKTPNNNSQPIEQPDIKLVREEYDIGCRIGFYNNIENTIYLDLRGIEKYYKMFKDNSIEKFACRVINHEFLHHILLKEHWEEPGVHAKLDNLTHGKQTDPKIKDYYLS